jgi:peroxiredoxin
MTPQKLRALVVTAALAALACSKDGNSRPPGSSSDVPADPADAPNGTATLGAKAPDFALPALDGGKVRLSDFKGKVVVLEWFNPDCPFVRQSHTEGTLKGLAAKYKADGVVWLAINSNAPGSQGSDEARNREGREKFGIDYPILLDREGRVGRAYGAERTPHMYVVAPDGTLVYRGAIDNSKGGDIEDVEGTLVNYVADALAALKDGRKVSAADTTAWGCTVKYKD